MKLKKWIKYFDMTYTPHVMIWTTAQLKFNEDTPIYEGSLIDIPWWIANCKLSKIGAKTYKGYPLNSNLEGAITFVEKFDHYESAGFIIVVEETDEYVENNDNHSC